MVTAAMKLKDTRSYHVLVTWLIIHWSRNWSCTDHVADHALITWVVMHWSRGWSCTDHVTDHALITWLSCPAYVADHTMFKWLPCAGHVTDHALIMWLIMHWWRGYNALITWLDTICRDFGAPKSKVSHCFHCFPIYLLWSDGTRYHDLSFLNVEL